MNEQTRATKAWGAAAIILLLLFLDQAFKIWVKTHMALGESITIFPWFQLYFTENPGMAFGMEFFNKLVLSVFRIVAVVGIGYYLVQLIRKEYPMGYIVCIAMIFAGALGNIIDSVFYGVIFNHSYGQVATLMPESGGYAPLLHGKVVDMLYFPLIETTLPAWVPIFGGQEFVFFRPIFNLADSSICVGVFLLLIFHSRTLSFSLSKRPSSSKDEKE